MRSSRVYLVLVMWLVLAARNAAQTSPPQGKVHVPSWCTPPYCNPNMFKTTNCKNKVQSGILLAGGVGWVDKNIRNCYLRIWACGPINKDTTVAYSESCPPQPSAMGPDLPEVCCDPAGPPPSCTPVQVSDQKGFAFLAPQNGKAILYQDPSTSSPTVGNPPVGARLLYTQVRYQQNGEPAWYFFHPPAATPGWFPAGDVSGCRPPSRLQSPIDPKTHRSIFYPDWGPPFTTTGGATVSARG